MGKFVIGIIAGILVLALMATYPIIAVSLTAIAIVGMFLLFKND